MSYYLLKRIFRNQQRKGNPGVVTPNEDCVTTAPESFDSLDRRKKN